MSRFWNFLRQYPFLRLVTPRVYCVDVGSSTTRVVVDGKLVYQQPSCLVVHTPSGTVVELGKKAQQMVGKTPAHLSVLYPVERGYIKDQLVFSWYIQALFQKISAPGWWQGLFFTSRVYIALPSGTSDVEKELWVRSWQQLGLGRVTVVGKPHALMKQKALNEKTDSSTLKVFVDSGGGSTEVVVVCGSDVLTSKTVPVGGNDISQVLLKTILKEYACEVGFSTAEKIKTNIRSQESIKSTIRGKNVLTGLPTTIAVDNQVIVEAAMAVLKPVGRAIKEAMAKIPAETLSQTNQLQVLLMGGNGLFWGYDLYLQDLLKAVVTKSTKPGEEVINGLLEISKEAAV